MQQPSRESSSSSTSSTATAPASPRDDDVDDLRLLLKRRDAELASLQQSLSIEKREHQLTTSKLSRMLQKRGASAGPSDDEVRIRHRRPSPATHPRSLRLPSTYYRCSGSARRSPCSSASTWRPRSRGPSSNGNWTRAKPGALALRTAATPHRSSREAPSHELFKREACETSGGAEGLPASPLLGSPAGSFFAGPEPAARRLPPHASAPLCHCPAPYVCAAGVPRCVGSHRWKPSAAEQAMGGLPISAASPSPPMWRSRGVGKLRARSRRPSARAALPSTTRRRRCTRRLAWRRSSRPRPRRRRRRRERRRNAGWRR